MDNLLGLDLRDETVSREEVRDGAEVDLVTHDARKFFGMMLKKNGYVLEQLLSPLVVHAAPGFEELRELARGCVTRNHAHHYQGFATNQWQLFEREQPRRVKPLLYCYRVLLTGIHLLRSGEVEANLVTLNEGEFHLPHVTDLLAAKRGGNGGRDAWATTRTPSPSTRRSLPGCWPAWNRRRRRVHYPNCPGRGKS